LLIDNRITGEPKNRAPSKEKEGKIMKKWSIAFTITVFVLALTLGASPDNARAAEVIKWGVLIDLSGPTSDWGKNQVKGQLDAMRWINEHGGINGKELKLIVIDDGYKVPRGVAGYNRLVDSEKVPGLYLATTGWLIRKKSQGFIFNLRAPP
jgi:branched-chain amino acid transport system substrate-binding protein